MKTPQPNKNFTYLFFFVSPFMSPENLTDLMVEKYQVPQNQARNFILGVMDTNFYWN